MSEQQKTITQEVVYICEPLQFGEKEKGFFDSVKEGAGGIVDKVMPENTVGKVAVGGGLAALAFMAAAPLGFVSLLAAGGAAAGVAGANALLSDDNKKIPMSEAERQNLTVPQLLALAKQQFKADKKVRLDDIAVVPCDVAKQIFDADGITLKNIKRLTAGMILIEHPFLPNTYIDAKDAEKELFHQKQLCISAVMQYLGATKVEGHAEITEMKKRAIDGKGNVAYGKTNLSAEVQIEQKQQCESKYKILDTWPDEFSPEQYELAKAEASKYGLDKDDDIVSLIERRNPANPRPIGSREISVEISTELNRSLDTAFSLEVAGAEVGGGYKEILENSKHVSFVLKVQF